MGTLQEAVNIPLNELEERKDQLDRQKNIVLVKQQRPKSLYRSLLSSGSWALSIYIYWTGAYCLSVLTVIKHLV